MFNTTVYIVVNDCYFQQQLSVSTPGTHQPGSSGSLMPPPTAPPPSHPLSSGSPAMPQSPFSAMSPRTPLSVATPESLGIIPQLQYVLHGLEEQLGRIETV